MWALVTVESLRWHMEHIPALPGQPPAPLHPVLAAVLHRLAAAEAAAAGSERRVAYRLTRAVLGAARRQGVTLTQLADCLSVSVSAMRGRAITTDVTLSAGLIEQLTGRTPDQLSGQSTIALLPVSGGGQYHVDDVVRTILAPSANVP